jgi:hypothetical protein
MGSTRELALASFILMSVGLVAWVVVRRRWPETGRRAVAAAVGVSSRA